MLSRRVDGISQNLHKALHGHSRHTHEDIAHSLIEHARTVLIYEKQLLRELESLRPDFANINKKAADVRIPVTSPRQTLAPPGSVPRTSSAPDLARTPRENGGSFAHPAAGPPLPGPANGPIVSPAVPVAAAAAPAPGRVDGTQSMFITPPAPYQTLPLPPEGGRPPPASPGYVAQRAVFGSPGPSAPPTPIAHDPLGAQFPQRRMEDSIHGRPGQLHSGANTMARSMYVQPTRSRLDAREAAAKLANFL